MGHTQFISVFLGVGVFLGTALRCSKQHWVMTLPAKLMYGMLSSTAGFVSIACLQREILPMKKISFS